MLSSRALQRSRGPLRPSASSTQAQSAVPKLAAPTPALVPGYTSYHWGRLWRSTHVEESYEIATPEQGALPADLQGTFFRAGPGLFELPSGDPLHPFDAHGLVLRATISEGKVSVVKRFVRTKAYVDEVGDKGRSGAGLVRTRGYFTDMPGGVVGNAGHRMDRPVANAGIIELGMRVLATWPGGRPYALDPASLDTVGESDLGSVFGQGHAFGARALFCPKTGNSVVFGADPARKRLKIAELDAAGKAVFDVEYALPDGAGVPLLNDMALTEHWYIFFVPPMAEDPMAAVQHASGAAPAAHTLRFQEGKPGKWLLFPRLKQAPRGAVVLEAPSQFLWSFVNAFDDPLSGRIVVDACTSASLDLGAWDPKGRPAGAGRTTLRRFTLNPYKQATTNQAVLLDQHVAFPQMNPTHATQPYRFVYLTGSKTSFAKDNAGYKSLIKFNLQSKAVESSWVAPEGCFLMEAVFAPRRGLSPRRQWVPALAQGTGPEGELSEDDGYLVTLLFDAEAGGAPEGRSKLLVFSARDPGAGPLATLRLNTPVPASTHCLWSAAVY